MELITTTNILSTAILLLIGIIGYFLKDKLKNLDKLDSRISQITNAIVEIQTMLTGRGYSINQKLVITSASPTRLTDYGEQMMQETGFYKITEANKRFLIDKVTEKNPKTNYDIQEFSLLVLKDLVVQNHGIRWSYLSRQQLGIS